MKKTTIRTRIFAAVLALSLIAVVLLCVFRVRTETQDRSVSVVMSLSDVELLAAESGTSLNTWLTALAEAGVAAIITEDGGGTAAARISAAGLYRAGPDGDWPVCFDPDNYVEGQALALIENESRTGSTLDAAVRDDFYARGVPLCKCLYLYPDYAARYGREQLGYTGSEEVENLIYRALTDRSIRILWLTPLTDGGAIVTDPDVYAKLIYNVTLRINEQGLTMSYLPSALTAAEPNAALLALACWGVCAVAILLLHLLVPLGDRLAYLLLALGALLSAAVGLTQLTALVKLMALAAAVVFPALGVAHLARRLTAVKESLLLGDTLVTLLAAVLPALLGGLWVGAILSSHRYLLELELFSGVKLSQALPLLYGLVILWKALWHRPGRSLWGDVKERLTLLKDHAALKLTLTAVVLVLAVFVFLLRTGDGLLGVPWAEQRVRNWLEQALYVRPRTKEFLIAWPALALAVQCGRRHWKTVALPLGLLAAIGLCSVTNTFCHIRAELLQSLIRTGLGLGFGFVLGFVAAALLGAIGDWVKRRRVRR